jgi:hypothetical protein
MSGVSFDLYVWHEPDSISVGDAEAKLEPHHDGEPAVFAAHPAVGRCFDALVERFPLEGDDSVWSVPPARSETLLELFCVSRHGPEIADVLRDLAAEHGVVCYVVFPRRLQPDGPGFAPRFTMTSAALRKVYDPDADEVRRQVTRVGRGNEFAILERADGRFVQVGYGDFVGVPPGTYALEYREGDDQYQAKTTDVAMAVRFLQEFLAGDETWKRRHLWRRLEL